MKLGNGMYARILGALVLGTALSTASALAQESVPPPLVKDIAAGATLPQDGVFDIRGVKLGSTYDEVKTALKELSTSTVNEQKFNLGLNDGRGNSVAFRYDAELQAVFTTPEGAGENFKVEFSPGTAGIRAVHLMRYVSYSNDASMPKYTTLVESLVQKYGPPSFESRSGGLTYISWMWHQGKRVAFPAGDPRRTLRSAGPPGSPEGCLGGPAYGWRYRFEQTRQDLFPGCGAMMTAEIFTATQAPDLVRSFTINMVDKMRFHQAATATDAWLLSEMQAKANAQAPRSGPKL